MDSSPYSSDNPLNTDTGNDGYFDFDEILRGSDPHDAENWPLDSDGDGWSNFDEALRRTADDQSDDQPTATRLYEVEIQLSGHVLNHNNAGLEAGIADNITS
ncbi:MAG: hypothetical protein CSA23_02290 [Deltaproteobacteria bacterium]|nr:MAG: hypothetical protein CSA23_02290 [Deltaproteobacteria bacterium]